jgi:hypothetical protein
VKVGVAEGIDVLVDVTLGEVRRNATVGVEVTAGATVGPVLHPQIDIVKPARAAKTIVEM